MSRFSWFLTTALVGTQMVLVQPAVMAAKSAAEVKSIARGVTVEIQLQQNSSVGSGIIIARAGDLYTIATNRHVVCGKGSRKKVPAGETYELGLVDGQKYRVKATAVKLIGTDLDLAIVQFRSSRKYPVVQLGTASVLKADDVVYTAGFPLEQPGFSFNQGEAVDRRITDDRGGYSIVYNAFTLPGMSGGGVFDRNGLLVAIHGQGDRFGENTELDDKSQVGSKIGYNRGIPIRWVVQGLTSAGVKIGGNRQPPTLATTSSQASVIADEYFIAGFNKLVEPGDDVSAGKIAAIGSLNKAIQINPRYSVAYFTRAVVYAQLQQFQQSLIDYDRAIAINPQDANAYNNRGILKKDKLNDSQGALADYNKAIIINPEYANAYMNRGNLKRDKLNDNQGALSDYDRAIVLNPKSAGTYNNRGKLKQEKLNDNQGALADFDRAISLNPQSAQAYYNRGTLKNNKLNDSQGALADFDRAIYFNPQLVLAYNNRGNLKHDKLNDSQGALTDYDRAIALNPQDALAYINRGVLKKSKLNDSQGALTDYDRAISLNPQSAQAYYNRGNLKYEKLNDNQGALADYDRAIFLNPKLAEVYYNRGNLKYTNLNDIQGALADYDRAISINLQFAHAYSNRGILKKEKLNDKAGAIVDLRQAVKLFRAQGQTQISQKVLSILQQLGVTE
jgi:tetratricopeptide (TPR) repeat protein